VGTEGVALGEGGTVGTGLGEWVLVGSEILRQACGAGPSSSPEQVVTAIPASAVATKIARLRRISLLASSSSWLMVERE
jgi:hypothetical protein